MGKRIISFVLFIMMLLSLVSCGASDGPHYYRTSYKCFNTVSRAYSYRDIGEASFNSLMDEAFLLLEEYNNLYDIYFEYAGINNIKTINKNAGKKPVVVDERIIDLIEYGIEVYDLTGGEVNIAMGAVLKLWHNAREDAEDGIYYVPDIEALRSASAHTDIKDIIIDRENSTVYLSDAEMSLDVGSIGKGYATERIAEFIEERGYTSFALNFGGNIRLIGDKPTRFGTEPFTIGVKNPDKNAEDYVAELLVSDVSVVTSGDYERYYTVDGVNYHHIIDKDTLMPSAYFSSVTIVVKDSALADALSTALFSMPYESGKALADSLPGVEACWVDKDGDVLMTDGFAALTKK